jgi:hypothetical protein
MFDKELINRIQISCTFCGIIILFIVSILIIAQNISLIKMFDKKLSAIENELIILNKENTSNYNTFLNSQNATILREQFKNKISQKELKKMINKNKFLNKQILIANEKETD